MTAGACWCISTGASRWTSNGWCGRLDSSRRWARDRRRGGGCVSLDGTPSLARSLRADPDHAARHRRLGPGSPAERVGARPPGHPPVLAVELVGARARELVVGAGRCRGCRRRRADPRGAQPLGPAARALGERLPRPRRRRVRGRATRSRRPGLSRRGGELSRPADAGSRLPGVARREPRRSVRGHRLRPPRRARLGRRVRGRGAPGPRQRHRPVGAGQAPAGVRPEPIDGARRCTGTRPGATTGGASSPPAPFALVALPGVELDPTLPFARTAAGPTRPLNPPSPASPPPPAPACTGVGATRTRGSCPPAPPPRRPS